MSLDMKKEDPYTGGAHTYQYYDEYSESDDYTDDSEYSEYTESGDDDRTETLNETLETFKFDPPDIKWPNAYSWLFFLFFTELDDDDRGGDDDDKTETLN